ncbi:MAG: hypothetical protein QOJ76_51 [Acidobacteriota bacterium]|nr:hypothetical protein [Acidobacteriota bacterium]
MPFTEPMKYAVEFTHTDWLDNVDRVQAGGANGFNERFHSLEQEFASIQDVLDNAGAVAKEIQAAIDAIENQLKGTWTLENLNVPGKLGVGTTQPGAKLTVVGPGASVIGGTALSSTFVTSAGTLGTPVNSEIPLANVGYNASGNNASLGVRARRVAAGGGWETTSIGLTMDVDDTPEAGAGIWLRHNRNVGIGTATPEDRLSVVGGMRILTESNPIRFTAGWSGHADTNKAEISNDTSAYKTLMIIGNTSAGEGRKVGIWDKLDVNGSLKLERGGYVNEVSGDAGLSANSDAVIPTQRAVKTYVDKYPIVQSGRVGITTQLGTRTGNGSHEETQTQVVQFNRAFSGTPSVIVGTVNVDALHDNNLRFDVWVENESPTGFIIKFKTWANTEIYLLGVYWLAYGPA